VTGTLTATYSDILYTPYIWRVHVRMHANRTSTGSLKRSIKLTCSDVSRPGIVPLTYNACLFPFLLWHAVEHLLF
jgi:hypothetical protein